MFGLFKKKQSSNPEKEVALLIEIFKALGKSFSHFEKQLQDGVIIAFRRSDKPVPGYVSFAYNNVLLNKHENKSGRTIALRGVRVFDGQLNDYVEIQINIAYGIIQGYFPKGKALTHPITDRIGVDGYSVHYTGEDEYDPVKNLIHEEDAKWINPIEVYEVKLKGKVFYHLADLEGEDGDFIGVDKNKKLYKITHDPFEISEVSGSFASLIGKQ